MDKIINKFRWNIFIFMMGHIYADKYIAMFIRDNLSYISNNYMGYSVNRSMYIRVAGQYINMKYEKIQGAYKR